MKFCNPKKSIFSSITQLGDEITYCNTDDENKVESPTVSIKEIIEKYIKYNSHISIISLIKIIDKNINNNNITDEDIIRNINYYLYKIYVPEYSSDKNIPIM